MFPSVRLVACVQPTQPARVASAGSGIVRSSWVCSGAALRVQLWKVPCQCSFGTRDFLVLVGLVVSFGKLMLFGFPCENFWIFTFPLDGKPENGLRATISLIAPGNGRPLDDVVLQWLAGPLNSVIFTLFLNW